MGALFGQLWLLMLIAFAVGSLLAWGAVRLTLPTAREVDRRGHR